MPAFVLRALAVVFGRPSGRWAIALAVAIVIGLPLVFMTAVLAVIGEQHEAVVQACGPTLGTAGSGVGVGGPLPAGLTPGARARFYEPLHMQPGRWYRTGATRFANAPGDATAYGSIPDPAQKYLPAHPDTFAELALASTNPANYRDFRFEDADALGRLPYMAAVRVERGGHSVVVYKRDVGYGQGTDTTASGERYRIDLWGPSADAIGVSKDEVRIALAAPNGTAQTLGDTQDAALEEPEQSGQPRRSDPPDRHGGIGFTPATGTDFTSGEEPEIARRADALGRALHLRLTGVSGRRTPEHNASVGGAPGSAHLTGRAADIDGLQAVTVATLHHYGLDRPVSHYVDSSGHTHDERDHVALRPGSAPPALDDPATLAQCNAVIDAAPSDGGPLPLTPGERSRLLPNGLAAAPEGAPVEVKRMIAAGNEIVGRPYLLGGGHGAPLSQVADSYDCSSAVAHLLYGARLVDASYTPASGDLDDFGEAGYGRWVSVLSNANHAYLYVAGLRFDTHNAVGGERGNAGIGWHSGHRDDVGFTARHPKGL
jgi:hypothetical protein